MRLITKKFAFSAAFALVASVAAVAQDFPKADLLFGYSGFRANPARNIPSFISNGGSAPFTWNFNRYVGFETEFAGYNNSNINNIQFDTTEMTYLFGPRFSFSRARTVVPYIHTLFGGVHLTTSLPVAVVVTPLPTPLPTPTPVSTATTVTRLKASQDAFAMAIGGGIDVRVSHHITLRPMQFDYLMTRLEDFGQSGQPSENRNQHNVRFSAGLMFNFGGERASPPPPPEPPPPPVALRTKQCPGAGTVPIEQECPKQNLSSFGIVVNPNQICQGSTTIATPSTPLPQGAVTQWTINGEPVSQASTLEFGSTGRDPGAYKIGLKVTAQGYNDVSTDTAVTVLGYIPPSGGLSVSPPELFAGEKATLSATFAPGQCGGALGPVTFSAAEGSVSGDQYTAAGVQFAPPGTSDQRKTIAITAKVSDEKGSGSAQANVVVTQRALTSARLPDVLFAQDSDRVNNCGKRVLLEELHTLANNDPSGRVVFVGHSTESERASKDLDLKRALNAAAVISAGQEVCTAFPASQIYVNAAGAADNGVRLQPNFCSGSTAVAERPGQTVDASDDSAKYRRVEVWFVPNGGASPASGAGAEDAASLGVSRLGCPR